jgi:RNA polymerase sigma-70 factor (ECF subfamily)
MPVPPRPEVEQAIADAHAAGDMTGAATLAYAQYGPEILAFLERELGDPDLAADAHSQLGLDLWRGLPGFRFEASVRTWAYRLARNAMLRIAGDPYRRRGLAPLPHELSRIRDATRSATAPWRRTTARDTLALIRAELAPDDRALLTLRLDRAMTWRDIALVFAPEADGEAPQDAALRTRAAALRKRWERLKQRLRRSFEEAGLLPADGEP